LTWRNAEIEKSRVQSNIDYATAIQVALTGIPEPIAHYGSEVRDDVVSVKSGSRNIWGIYLQDKYRVNEYISATLGVRYDHYSDFGHSINPRLALLYSPRRNTRFKWLYGEAFRAPSLRQLNGAQSGNLSLKSEKIKTAEVAWLQVYPKHKLQTTLTYHYNWHSDLVDTVPSATSTLRVFDNLPDTLNTAGWELEASMKPSKNLSLRLAYSYLQETEQSPRRFPRQTFALVLNYQLARWNFNLSGYFHDTVEYQLTRRKTIELDAYWHLNSTVRYQVDKNLYLVGRISNLLDEDYYSSTKTLTLPTGLPNRGRTANLGIEFSW